MRKNQFKKQGWFAVFKIPKFRLFGGVVAGMTFAFSLYALLYLMREVMRMMSYSPYTHDLWVMPDEAVHFYNLFFAYISVISGLSVSFEIWYNRPKRMFEFKNKGVINFLTDQGFAKWIVLFILMSIYRSIGLFFANAYMHSYRDFQLYPDYKYLLYLVIIVFFGQTMLNYRQKFTRSGIKFIGFSILGVVMLSWALSKIDLIDYHRINSRLISANPYEKYHFQLPVVSYAKQNYPYRPFTGVVILKNSKKAEFVFGNKPVSFARLPDAIRKKKEIYKAFERPVLHVGYLVDKSVKMRYINQLKLILEKEKFKRMVFYLLTKQDKSAKRDVYSTGLDAPLGYVFSDSLFLVKRIKEIDSIAQIIPLQLQASGQLKVQDTLWQSTAQIRNKLSGLIAKNPHTYFILKTDDKANFDAYAKVISAYKFSLDSLRQDYYKKHPAKSFMGVGIGAEETYPYLLLDLIE